MKNLISILSRFRILPVVVIDDEDHALPLADALADGGLPVVEITFRTASAAKAVQLIRKHRPGFVVGAGTLVSKDDVEKAKDSGASFGVAPGCNQEIIRHSKKLGLPFMPGVMTPGEIETAYGEGIHLMKFFPAEPAGGVCFLKSIGAPYQHLGIQFVPTGGIHTENLASYLALSSVLAAGGTWLATREDIQRGEWDKIRTCCLETVNLISQWSHERKEG